MSRLQGADLAEFLGSKQYITRTLAYDALWEAGEEAAPRVVPVLLKHVDHSDPKFQLDVLMLIHRLRPGVHPELKRRTIEVLEAKLVATDERNKELYLTLERILQIVKQ